MSKLEEVAKAIFYKESENGGMCSAVYNYEWWELEERVKNHYHELAQAAIDALGVIILPKDAEPMQGDVVRYYRTTDNKDIYKEIYATFKYGCHDMTVHYGYAFKIIQRNGKSVIMEG